MEKKTNSFFKKKKAVAVPNQDIKNKRQEEFNKTRKGLEEQEKQEKKPFDKKAYRLKKYSKKYKLEQWEEQRKKRMLREYHKDIKNHPTVGTYKPKTFDEDTPDGTEQVGKYVRHPDFIDKENTEGKKENSNIKIKKDPYHKAKEQFNKVKQEKINKQQEREKVKEEKKQKLEEYNKKKHDRFKKLSKKTKKGQPVMTGRLELLLEKIQSSK